MAKKIKQTGLTAKLASLFLIFLYTVFLFFFDRNGYAGIAEAKLPVFYCICGGFALLSLLFFAEELVLGERKLSQFAQSLRNRRVFLLLLFLYLLLTVVSALCSAHPEVVWLGAARKEGVLTIGICVLCCFFTALAAQPRRWMIYGLGIALCGYDILCIVQLCGGNPFSLYPQGMNYYDAFHQYAGAFLGTVGNIDFVGAFFCAVIPPLWVYLIRGREKPRFLLLLPLLLSLAVVWKMDVSAAVVGLGVGFVVSLPVILPLGKKTRLLLLLIPLGCLLLGALGLYLFDFGSGLLHEIHGVLHGNFDDSFGSGRIFIWRSLLPAAKDSLLVGHGPDTVLFSGIEPFSNFHEDIGQQITSYTDAAHNEYLQILYCQGLPALLAYLAALGAALVHWVRSADKNPVAAMFGTAVLCYAIQAFFGISYFISAPFFWVCLGLLFADAPLADCQKPQGKPDGKPSQRKK